MAKKLKCYPSCPEFRQSGHTDVANTDVDDDNVIIISTRVLHEKTICHAAAQMKILKGFSIECKNGVVNVIN